jgi:type VI secretion system secreted protein VgrG
MRMEAEAAGALVVTGTSTARAFAPGARFSMSGHANGDGAYLLTGVQHSASQPAGANGDAGLRYANSFTCIPAGVPYRRRTRPSGR